MLIGLQRSAKDGDELGEVGQRCSRWAQAALLASIFPQLPRAGFLAPRCVRVGAGQLATPAAGGIHCSKCQDVMANAALAAAARSVLTAYTQLHAALAADGAGGSPMALENSVIPLLVFCHPGL